MAVTGKLAATRRTQQGSRGCRHLRDQGLVPGNVYGHKQENLHLAVPAAELETMIRAGTRVLDLDVEGKVEKVLFREVQWDYLGQQILHVDLLRVDPDERLTVEVKVELRGTAPGALGGGVMEQILRTLHVECLAIQIPDSIVAKIGTLEVGQSLHVRDLEIPPNTKVLNNPDDIVVHIIQPGAEIPVAAEEGPAQPEVIGKKPAEGEEGAEGEKEKKK
jgi:large subunit ribosomal protein L25